MLKLNKRSAAILSVLLVLVLSALACSSGSEPAVSAATQETALKIESFKLLTDDGSGQPGAEVSSFKPSDHTQHFQAQLSKFINAGSTVKWVFTGVDTSAGKNLAITEVEIKAAIPANSLTSNLNLDQDFPTGTFKADVYVDGVKVGVIDYEVKE